MRNGAYKRPSMFGGYGAFIAIVAIVAVIFVGFLATSYYKDDSVTITVTDKESISTNGGHEYRISTTDEVYVMKDSLLKGRFRTANDYGRMQEGKTYKCEKFGWRIPFFSAFENLHDCTEMPA